MVKTLLNRARIDPGFTTLGRQHESSLQVFDLFFICYINNLLL